MYMMNGRIALYQFLPWLYESTLVRGYTHGLALQRVLSTRLLATINLLLFRSYPSDPKYLVLVSDRHILNHR